MISEPDADLAGVCRDLCGFRQEFYRCLSRRPDAANNRLAAGCPAVPDDPQADNLKLAVCPRLEA